MSEVTGEQSENTVGKQLFELFSDALELSDNIENSSLPITNAEYQADVKKCIGLFEDTTKLVSLVGMFSANENVEEIPTENLQFLLLPYFLGQIVQKMQTTDRVSLLQTSKVYFQDFLKRCEDYEIIQSDNRLAEKKFGAGNDTSNDPMQELLIAANSRNFKIEQYRKMKELEEQISALKLAAKNPHVDDEIKRKLYLKQINHGVMKSKEELQSIDQELQMLEYHMNVMKISESNDRADSSKMGYNLPSRNPRHHHQHQPKPLKPIIITKDTAQKAVFGLGYPSLPIMTVDEFYTQRVQEGIFPDEHKAKQMNAAMMKRQAAAANDGGAEAEDAEEAEKAHEEQLVDEDDDENLARMRAKDEYKDVVRRGDGNRYNRS